VHIALNWGGEEGTKKDEQYPGVHIQDTGNRLGKKERSGGRRGLKNPGLKGPKTKKTKKKDRANKILQTWRKKRKRQRMSKESQSPGVGPYQQGGRKDYFIVMYSRPNTAILRKTLLV